MSDNDTKEKGLPLAEDHIGYEGKPKTFEQEYVYPTHLDPNRQVDKVGGVYLDDVQRREAEIQRARIEGRKPDFETMGGTVGTPLVPLRQAKAMAHGGDTPVATKLPVVMGIHPDKVDGSLEARRQHREQNSESSRNTENKAD